MVSNRLFRMATCRRAASLSSTSTCGEDSTFTVVTACSAFSAAWPLRGPLSTKPGKPEAKAPAAAPAGLKLSAPLMPALKKNCVPYCRLSFSVTSATVASMRTCKGRMSILRSIASMVSRSDVVA